MSGTDFDVVILDVMMPRLDGLGVIDRLQKSAAAAVLSRTLVLTASNLARLPELPVFGVLHKPFNIGQLLRETESCLRADRAYGLMSPGGGAGAALERGTEIGA